MHFTLAYPDIIIILLYLAVVLYVGLVASRRKSSGSKVDFILAGRKLTVPLFVATLVATWYGNILGVGEFVYNYGIVAWVCFGIVYYIAAILYAFLVAGKIRKSETFTIPEKMTEKYGESAGVISSLIVLIITIPAAYVLMLGILLQLFTGWNLTLSIIIGTAVSLVYIYHGGFKSDVLTNAVQFFIMYAGFGALLVFTLLQYGSPLTLFDKLPANHVKVFGGFSWTYILAWFFIAFQTFVDPSFYQRCLAAETPQTAKKGILISVAFWLLFDIMTLITGLYAKVYFTNIEAVMAYPALGESVLPVVWKGLFITALLSTVMSTLDSYAFLSATTIGNDILKKVFKTRKTTDLTKAGLIITGVFSILLALILPSPIEIVFRTASVAVPGLIVPLIIAYTPKLQIKQGFVPVIMLVSSAVAFLWLMLQSYGLASHPILQIEPMLAGLLVSLVLAAAAVRRV
jgi:SSS family solute:Na+ symporter